MDEFGGQNFSVIGFPCNQFGHQSPEENSEVLNVLKYVRPGGGFVPKFPVYGRVKVNGLHEHPLFTYLKMACPYVNPILGNPRRLSWSPVKVSDIRWNFEKFIVRVDGTPYKR
ncbi:glutathione peroxidase 6-like [Chanos chanos]|uniref:Glutathione peroxidase n=1 Tax=Chanos chanos TaxID=29144 RepID=A0A6J2V9N0_CHACN|nr:glutathione peroxidase 6-like [Chanos chanos]